MTLEELYYISQIVAVIAIFCSLIFVGLQTRQTARNQRALMHANRNQSITESLRSLGDPALARIYMAGSAATPGMDPLEVNQFVFLARATFSGMQHQFLEWREGLIDDVRWKITRDSLNILLTTPGHRAAYLMWREYGATPQFRAVCDDILQNNECRMPADTSAIWHALAAQQVERIRLKNSEQKALPQEAGA
jgi:hypothetical protein